MPDDAVAQILSALAVIQEDVRQITLSLHGGRDSKAGGKHVKGLLAECDDMRRDVDTLKVKADEGGNKLWAVLLVVVSAVISWVASHIDPVSIQRGR